MLLLFSILFIITFLLCFIFISFLPRYRIIEKIFAITILFFLCFSLDPYYYTDFSHYVSWIISSEQMIHYDYIFNQLLRLLNLLPNPDISLRLFIFLFYAYIFSVNSRYNLFFFITNPLILDCIFNSQRSSFALSLIFVFFSSSIFMKLLCYAFTFYIHRLFSCIMIVVIISRKLYFNYKTCLFILFIGILSFIFAKQYSDIFEHTRSFIYLFVSSGKNWDEFYVMSLGSAWSSLSRLIITISPIVLILFNWRHTNKKIAVTVLITTLLILIFCFAFPVIYRLVIFNYLLLTKVNLKDSKSIVLKFLLSLFGIHNLLFDVEYIH